MQRGDIAARLRRNPASLKPGAPLVYALARTGAREDAFDAQVHRVQVAEELLQVEVQVLQEVHLVHQHEVRRAEHQGVLEGFLLALCDRVDHHPRVLPVLELRRTHQVPDVLYDEDIHLFQRELGEAGAHHVRVEVALPAEAGVRVYLHQRDVKAGQAVGVEGRLHVALQDAQAKLAAHAVECALQERRLARPRGAHHVDHVRPGPLELHPVGLGEGLVGVQDAFQSGLLYRRAMHRCLPLVGSLSASQPLSFWSSAGCSSISSDSTYSSSPSRIWSSKLLHAGHCRGKLSGRLSAPQARHFPATAISSISSSAPSTGVPWATSSKLKARAEGTTWRRWPTFRYTFVTWRSPT